MIGIGADIVSLKRMRDTLAASGSVFLDTVYTPSEQKAAREHERPDYYYAKCFAAKEAVFKTLNTSWDSGIALSEIEVGERDTGQPFVVLHGRARELAQAAGASDVLLSLSYDEDYAVAFAILT